MPLMKAPSYWNKEKSNIITVENLKAMGFVDFDKDLQINISIKALPGDGDIKALKITLKDIELQDFDPLQERLSFEMSNQNLVNQ